jgi:tRNA A-37 threonylcarbamoyl transferase component Bud32
MDSKKRNLKSRMKPKSPVGRAKSPVGRVKSLTPLSISPTSKKRKKDAPLSVSKKANFEKKFSDDVVLKELFAYFTEKAEARENIAKSNIFREGTLRSVLSNDAITNVNVKVLKERFKSILSKQAVKANEIMFEEYKILLKKVPVSDVELWKTKKFVYKNMQPIASGNNVIIYSADQIEMGKKTVTKCVIKCYIKLVVVNTDSEYEFDLQEKLANDGYNVPKLFPTFETTYYVCHPMEKLDEIISDMPLKEGFGIDKTLKIGKVVASIFKAVHEYGYFYSDLSLNNIGYMNGQPYLIDFGAVRRLGINGMATATQRYAARNFFENSSRHITAPSVKANEADDYEVLGLVLLDICFGFSSFPDLKDDDYNIESVNSIIETYKNSKNKDAAHAFFKNFFTILTTVDNAVIDKAFEQLFK